MSGTDKFLVGLGLFSVALFLVMGYMVNNLVSENKELRKDLAATNRSLDNFKSAVSVERANSSTKFDKLSAELLKSDQKIGVLEESLDPKNTRWAKIKKVRQAVRKTIEDYRYTVHMSTPQITMYAASVVDYSEQFDVPIPLILAMTRRESAFNPKAKSHANAHGLIQIIPSTAREIAGDLGIRHYSMFKIRDNVKFGVFYIMKMLDEFDGNKRLAVRAYNCGPTCVHKVLAGEWSDYPSETRTYVDKILGAERHVCHVTDNECEVEEGFIHYYEKMGL